MQTLLTLIGTCCGSIGLLLIPIIAMLYLKNRTRDLRDKLHTHWRNTLGKKGWQIHEDPVPSTRLGLKSLGMLSLRGRIEMDPVATITHQGYEVVVGLYRSKKKGEIDFGIGSSFVVTVRGIKPCPDILAIKTMTLRLDKRLQEHVSGYSKRSSPSSWWSTFSDDEAASSQQLLTDLVTMLKPIKTILGIECRGPVLAVYGQPILAVYGLNRIDRRTFRETDDVIKQAFMAFKLCGTDINLRDIVAKTSYS